MKVAQTLSFEETVVSEAPVPELEPGDALIRVEVCGLCGSDAHRWYVNQKAPTVLGHEPAGVVVAVGEGCAVSEGQRVFVHHHVSCGACHHCRRGFTTNCPRFKTSRLDPGGFAELVRVPRENIEGDTLVLPDSVSFEAATFIEPLACTVRALNKTPLQQADSVLVIGLGTMGFMNGLLARQRGASLVLGSDFSSERRGLAERDWGFDHTLDPSDDDFFARLRELTQGRGPDHVIVGPGSKAAVEQAIEAVAPGGSLVLFSPFARDASVELPLHKFYFGELTLVASYSCAAAETRAALELIASGAFPVEKLVSHRVDLAGVGDGILKTAAAGPGWLKALVYPHGVPLAEPTRGAYDAQRSG